MEEVKLDIEDPTLKFDFPSPESIGPFLVKFKEVDFYYDPAKPLFENLDFGVAMDSRIALVGANGVGKSTVMKLMAGILKETNGFIERHQKVNEWPLLQLIKD